MNINVTIPPKKGKTLMAELTSEKAPIALAEHLLCNEDLPPRHENFRCLIHDRLERILNNVAMLNDYTGKTDLTDPVKEDCPQVILADPLALETFLMEAPACINETCRKIRNELEVFATRIFGYSSFLDIYGDKVETSNDNALRHSELIKSYNYISDLEIIISLLCEKFFENNSIDAKSKDSKSEFATCDKFPVDLHYTGVFCPETKYNLDQIFDKCDEMLYRISVRIVEVPELEEAPAQ